MNTRFLFAAAVFSYSMLSVADSEIPGRIEAEDYTTYEDTTRGNTGRQYRSDDVDIQVTSDSGGGYNVGWIARGESLSFPVNVEQDGRYRVTVRVASARNGGRIGVLMDGEELRRPIRFGSTRGWQNWRTYGFNTELRKGDAELTLDFLSGGFNVNWVEFRYLGGGSNPTPTATPSPTRTPAPTPPPSGNCNLPYITDTEGRCLRPHRAIDAYCAFPSHPDEFKLTASPNTIFTCENPRSTVINGNTVVSASCPRPYQYDNVGECKLIVPSKNINCNYPLRIGEVRVNGSGGTRIRYRCDYTGSLN